VFQITSNVETLQRKKCDKVKKYENMTKTPYEL